MSQESNLTRAEKDQRGLNFKANKPNSARPYVAHISFSYAFGIVVLIEVLLLICLATIGYLGLQEYFQKLESSFYQRGKGLTLSMAAASSLAYKSRDYDTMINIMSRLVTQDEPVPREKAVSEVFLLDRSGVILAHSDVTMVTAKARDPLNSISLKYNNEFFHSSLLIDEGQVLTQKFPYPSTSVREKSSYIIQALLPENLDYSMDFSSPIVVNGKAVASIHVVMNRMFMYQFLINLFDKYVIITGIVLTAGLLIALFLLFSFVIRARYLHRVWQNVLRYKLENEMVNHEIHTIEKKMEDISKPQVPTKKIEPVKENNEIQDAILIE